MKRLFKTLVAIVLGISLLAGCSNGQGDTEGGGQTVGAAGMDAEGQEQDGERIRVTLGTVWSGNWELDNAVEAYNARNGKYYVEVVDCFPEDFEGIANDVYDAALDRLKMDLATGKGQDIIEFQYGLVGQLLYTGGCMGDLRVYPYAASFSGTFIRVPFL